MIPQPPHCPRVRACEHAFLNRMFDLNASLLVRLMRVMRVSPMPLAFCVCICLVRRAAAAYSRNGSEPAQPAGASLLVKAPPRRTCRSAAGSTATARGARSEGTASGSTQQGPGPCLPAPVPSRRARYRVLTHSCGMPLACASWGRRSVRRLTAWWFGRARARSLRRGSRRSGAVGTSPTSEISVSFAPASEREHIALFSSPAACAFRFWRAGLCDCALCDCECELVVACFAGASFAWLVHAKLFCLIGGRGYRVLPRPLVLCDEVDRNREGPSLRAHCCVRGFSSIAAVSKRAVRVFGIIETTYKS